MRGAAPSPPPVIVGRSEDLLNLKELLTKQIPRSESGAVCLAGRFLKELRSSKSLSQERLAQRTGNTIRTIMNAEAGRPIRTQAAIAIAELLQVPLDQLTAPAGHA
jgi:DNA-binding XRE family transcriptional regulator